MGITPLNFEISNSIVRIYCIASGLGSKQILNTVNSQYTVPDFKIEWGYPLIICQTTNLIGVHFEIQDGCL
jgi:hypothetical protein